MKKQLIAFLLLLCSLFLHAQNAQVLGQQLKKLNLISKTESLNKKDTVLVYIRLELLEKTLNHCFDKYDNLASEEKRFHELKSKQSKGEVLAKYEIDFLADVKPISLSDTCRWLIQALSKHKIISNNVKKQVEILLHEGHNNPADLLNAMHYLSAYEYLMLPKNLAFIVENFHKDAILTDEAKDFLLAQIKQNPKFDYLQIYSAYAGFRKLDLPTIKTKQALNDYLGNLINNVSSTIKIVDNQIVTEKDSVFDNIYDEVRDTSVWGLYEVNEHDFFTFKYQNELYKYPIYISLEEDSTIEMKRILLSDVLGTILIQITADAKLPFHPVVFNIADDIQHLMYGDYERYLKRIIPKNRLTQLGIWNLAKDGATRFYYWLPDGRTIDPKGLNVFDNVVTTANKYKLLKEAESLEFFENLTPAEVKDFKLKILPIIVDGAYNVIAEIPNLVFNESASDCMNISFSNLDDYPKNYERFLHKIVKNNLNNEIIIKSLSINTTQVKNKKLLDIETEKGKYHFEYQNSDDECELAFPTLMEICERENTKHKIYMNKVFKRNIFFVTDRQAAFLNKKYKLNLTKIYK